MEQIISTLIAVFIPIFITYINKRNKDIIRRQAVEEALKKIEFLDKYFDVSLKILPPEELQIQKQQLAEELLELKSNVKKQQKETGFGRLGTIQKLFLTFKPLSVMGWIWTILFYISFIIVIFGFVGMFVDENENFNTQQFYISLHDTDLIVGFMLFILLLLLFRWLGIRNYKKLSSKNLE